MRVSHAFMNYTYPKAYFLFLPHSRTMLAIDNSFQLTVTHRDSCSPNDLSHNQWQQPQKSD